MTFRIFRHFFSRGTNILALSAVLIALISSAVSVKSAKAEITIGISVPLNGQYELIANQLLQGAQDAVDAINQNRTDATKINLIVADDECSEKGGANAATALKQNGASIVVGFFCYRALAAALPVLKESGLSVVSAHVRHPHLADLVKKRDWPLYSLASPVDAGAVIAAKVLSQRWNDRPYALISDGGVFGRFLGEKFIREMETLEDPPDLIDNYRPLQTVQKLLLGRLKKAGVKAAFIAGDGEDIAVIARGAAEAGMDIEIAGSESLIELPFTGYNPGPIDGLLALLPVQPVTEASMAYDEKVTAQKRLPSNTGRIGYALIDLAVAAKGNMQTKTPYLTLLGTITFDQDRLFEIEPYKLHVWRDGRFVLAEQGSNQSN